MQLFEIGFKVIKNFLKSNLYILDVFNDNTTKVKFYFFNWLLHIYNDTGLDTQRFDQKINYNYITLFKFWLSLYPLLILTRTLFKAC